MDKSKSTRRRRVAVNPQRIEVRRGQVYRVPRGYDNEAGRRRPPVYIKVVGVRRGQQPTITYRLVTKTGRRARAATRWNPARWLHFYNGAWRLPPTWELVDTASRRR